MKKEKNIIILHNIRSVLNVGSIFRTADALGIDKIYISGYTPTPIDRFGRKRNDFHKSALGAEDSVAWEQVSDVFILVQNLKKENYKIIGIEQAENSVDYKEVNISEKNVFIMGTETTGIEKELLDLCDIIAEIPMKGEKESLNVSVAFGVALFRMLNI